LDNFQTLSMIGWGILNGKIQLGENFYGLFR